MTRDSTLDARLRRPYSIGTGIPIGGDAEIEGYLESLRVQGFCVIERVIPQDRVEEVRESVIEGREFLEKDRNREREQRVEASRLRLRGAAGDKSASDLEDSESIRPPEAPSAELCDIARNEVLAQHLAEPRILRVAKNMLDTHVRILQTEVNKSSRPWPDRPLSECQLRARSWHSDWPHDLSAYIPTADASWIHCGAVAQPFPDVCMALSTVWYLGPEDVNPLNGGTWVVPESHKAPRNPRGPDDGVDERAPIPGEFQVSGPAGSVFVQDTRIWHSGARNQSEQERTAVVVRYGPWWLSGNEFGNMHSGGRTIRTYVPKEVYDRFSPEVQLLYRHLAEGVEDVIQSENQEKALRAKFIDQPHLRDPDRIGDNSHVIAGAMTPKEWRKSQIQRYR